jgi:N6-L-threonylcarbamoyladenine synthase
VRIEAERISPLSDQDVADLCASFQAAIVDVVLDRLETALDMLQENASRPTAIVAAGGVAANQRLRDALDAAATLAGSKLIVPPAELCTDNGAMIAWAGAERLARGMVDGLDARARARWPLVTEAA